MKILIFFFLSTFLSFSNDKVAQVVKECREINLHSSAWWLSPQNAKWTRFTIRRLDKERSRKLILAVKKGRFTEDAADQHMLESKNFSKNTKIGSTGVFVLKSGEKIMAFGRMPNMISPSGLAILDCQKFDVEMNVFLWKSRIKDFGYGGVLLEKDIVKLME